MTATVSGRADYATRYQQADRALASHMATCRTCRSSNCGCPSGDDAAEQEYRTWRDWYEKDPVDATLYVRTQEP